MVTNLIKHKTQRFSDVYTDDDNDDFEEDKVKGFR